MGLIIRYASHNLRFIYSTNTKNFKECPKVSTGESRRKHVPTPMHRLPQCHLGNPRVECQNIYQVNQYDTPLSPRVFNCKTYIKCSQIHKSIQSDNKEISKGKLNSQQDREGKTPYDLTILTKPAIHQDHDISRTRERERSNTWLLVHTLSPEGELLPPRHGEHRDDEDGHQ